MTQVRIALIWVTCLILGIHLEGGAPYELKRNSCKKCWISEQTLGGNCNKYS